MGINFVLPPYQDDAGNIWGLWTPVDNAPYLVMGSHLDSVPRGGDFDGVFGVAAALEV
jgi:acetylornithine deacetylase/succinyl-diaminopimelate desuccinylase-like protein